MTLPRKGRWDIKLEAKEGTGNEGLCRRGQNTAVSERMQ